MLARWKALMGWDRAPFYHSIGERPSPIRVGRAKTTSCNAKTDPTRRVIVEAIAAYPGKSCACDVSAPKKEADAYGPDLPLVAQSEVAVSYDRVWAAALPFPEDDSDMAARVRATLS